MSPYQVLGVRENAPFDEVRSAYINLVKKYHPDRYTNSPLQAQAAEKLKEVNAAYETIKKQQESGQNTANPGASGSWQNTSSSYGGYTYTGDFAAEFSQAEAFIYSNNISQAQMILNRITLRNARWYYLSGLVAYKQNMHSVAAQYFENAYRMEPGNMEYKRAYDSVTNANTYEYRGYSGGNSSSCSTCDICSSLICADCCCEALGGDLIPCC